LRHKRSGLRVVPKRRRSHRYNMAITSHRQLQLIDQEADYLDNCERVFRDLTCCGHTAANFSIAIVVGERKKAFKCLSGLTKEQNQENREQVHTKRSGGERRALHVGGHSIKTKEREGMRHSDKIKSRTIKNLRPTKPVARSRKVILHETIKLKT